MICTKTRSAKAISYFALRIQYDTTFDTIFYYKAFEDISG